MSFADNEYLFTSESVTEGHPDQKTAAYGHFGRDGADFSGEQTDKAAGLADAAGLTHLVLA